MNTKIPPSKILVLDDLSGARSAVKYKILEKSPEAQIIEADSFPEAISSLVEARENCAAFDLLVADLTIGQESSKEGLSEIKTIHDHHPQLKILAVSGKGTYGAEALRAGAFAFFRKPKYSGLGTTVRYWRELEEMERFFYGEAMADSNDSPNYLLRLAEGNSVGISVVDRRLRVLYLNRHQEEMSEIISCGDAYQFSLCHGLFAEAGEPCPRCPVLEVFREKRQIGPVLHIRGAKYHRITAYPLRSAVNGEVLAVVKVAVDDTESEEFETFRRGLAGEGASLGNRIEMVLEAVASRGYRRPRLLLATHDGRHVESFRMQDQRLDDFHGQLEPISASPELFEVLKTHEAAVYPWPESSDLPCWQKIPSEEILRPQMQFGLVPMEYDGQVLGALYVDTHEAERDSPDLDVIVPLTKLDHQILARKLSKFAVEGGKAIVESYNMEMARQFLASADMDHAVFLSQMDNKRLFNTVLQNAIQIIKDLSHNRIVPKEQPEIYGHVMLKNDERLVRVTEINKSYDDFGRVWQLHPASPSLCVRAFLGGEIIQIDNLADSLEWQEFLTWIARESLAPPQLIEKLGKLRSYICLPLEDGNERIGTLSLQSPQPNLFTSQARELVKGFVRRAGHAVRVNRAFQRLQTYPETTMAMALAKSIIAGSTDEPRSIYSLLTALTHRDGFGFNRAIFFTDERNECGGMRFRATQAIGPNSREEGERLYEQFLATPPPALNELLQGEIRFSPVPTALTKLPLAKVPESTCKCRKEEQLLPVSIFEFLQVEEIIVLPIRDRDRTIAAVTLDNFVTPKEVNEESLKQLEAFALDYAMLLDNKRMVKTLRDEAVRKDELLHILAHQLRTDLTGPNQLIRRSLQNGSQLAPETLAVIAEKLWASTTAINDLLSFSVIESDRLRTTAYFQAFNISKLINETCQEVFVDALRRYRHQYKIDYTVNGDRGLLKQSLINLLDNARRYSKERTTIEVRVIPDPEQSGWLAVEIINTPKEIVEAAELERIFNKFERGTCGRYAPGTGLGLFVVNHTATLHGGKAFARLLTDGDLVFGISLPYCHS